MAQIYQFPGLRTTKKLQCVTCRTWSMADTDLKKLHENFTLYVATSDKYLAQSILHASKNSSPSPIEIAAAWQLGSISYSDKKLHAIFESKFQSLSQIRIMLMDFASNEKVCTNRINDSTSPQTTYSLKMMRAYTIFKSICLRSLSCKIDEHRTYKKISPASFSQALLENLIQDGFFKGST